MVKRMAFIGLISLVAVVVVGCGEEKPQASPAAQAGGAQSSKNPDLVLREFFYSMITNDEKACRTCIIADPNAEVLWQGEKLSGEHLAEAQTVFAQMTFRMLNVGDSVRVPGGGEVQVTGEMVSADCRLYECGFPDGNILQLKIVRQDSPWKVDASPLISARLAAKRVRDQKKDE